MALFGEIVTIVIGLFFIIGVGMLLPIMAAFGQSYEKWLLLIPLCLGVFILWAGIHYGPLVMSVQ